MMVRGTFDITSPLKWLKSWRNENQDKQLQSPDQITVSAGGFPLVAEDGDNNGVMFFRSPRFCKTFGSFGGPLVIRNYWASFFTRWLTIIFFISKR